MYIFDIFKRRKKKPEIQLHRVYIIETDDPFKSPTRAIPVVTKQGYVKYYFIYEDNARATTPDSMEIDAFLRIFKLEE